MKVIVVVFYLVLFGLAARGQEEKLPDVLKPDAASELEAQRMGAKVFKIVPYTMFQSNPYFSMRPEDNPIGLRGGGGYYSFSTGDHSIGSSQIVLGASGDLDGRTYGFFASLGERDLTDLDAKLPEAAFFLEHKPPQYKKDLEKERSGLIGKRIGQMVIEKHPRPAVGAAYLFRTINPGSGNIAVVFKVLKIDRDGSMVIAWKKLADFPMQRMLLMSDAELQAKIDSVIAEESVADLTIRVVENELVVRGTCINDNLKRLIKALKDRDVKYLGLDLAAGCGQQVQQ
jgi:hypothetical protein